MEKKLLIIYSVFGKSLFIKKQINECLENLRSLFWHIDQNNLDNEVRVVVSANCSPDYLLNSIKKEFKNRITIFHYTARTTCQIAFNKTCMFAEEYFDEKYLGFCSMTSGVKFKKQKDLFPRAIAKLSTNEYGMIAFQADNDHNYNYLGYLDNYRENIDFSKDYQIPIGCLTIGHCQIFHKDLKEFYGKPWCDVFGRGNQESSYSYVCAALRKKYILMGDSEVHEESANDNQNTPYSLLDMQKYPWPNKWYVGLMFGRTFEKTFLADKEGIDAGLGWHCEKTKEIYIEHGVMPLEYLIDPKHDKYDENYLSLDERLKYSVKRNYFSTIEEINYDKIKVDVVN